MAQHSPHISVYLTLCQVLSGSGRLYTCFTSRHYCLYPAFSFSVLRRNESLMVRSLPLSVSIHTAALTDPETLRPSSCFLVCRMISVIMRLHTVGRRLGIIKFFMFLCSAKLHLFDTVILLNISTV